MKKLVIILSLLVTILTATNANEIYTNDIESKIITLDNIKYVAFTFENSKILEARDRVLWDLEDKNIELNGDNFLLETKLMQASKKKQIYKYTAIGFLAYIIVSTTIQILTD